MNLSCRMSFTVEMKNSEIVVQKILIICIFSPGHVLGKAGRAKIWFHKQLHLICDKCFLQNVIVMSCQKDTTQIKITHKYKLVLGD